MRRACGPGVQWVAMVWTPRRLGVQHCQRQLSGQFGSDSECKFSLGAFHFCLENMRRGFVPASELNVTLSVSRAALAVYVRGVWSEEGCSELSPEFPSVPPSAYSYYIVVFNMLYVYFPCYCSLGVAMIFDGMHCFVLHRPFREFGCEHMSWDTVVSTVVGSRH